MNVYHEVCASVEDLGDLKGMEVTVVNGVKDSEGNEGVILAFVGKQGEKVSVSIMEDAEIHRTPRQFPVYCGQDLKEYEGYTIVNVESDNEDLNPRITLENAAGDTAILIMGGLSLDGESLFIEKE